MLFPVGVLRIGIFWGLAGEWSCEIPMSSRSDLFWLRKVSVVIQLMKTRLCPSEPLDDPGGWLIQTQDPCLALPRSKQDYLGQEI